jgi:hypothetical protein
MDFSNDRLVQREEYLGGSNSQRNDVNLLKSNRQLSYAIIVESDGRLPLRSHEAHRDNAWRQPS